jgi:hypothetical protein
MEIQAPHRLCQQCGMQIRGRSDKRFCDDTCRTAYHNYHYTLPSSVRVINNALQKNRRIILQLLGEQQLLKLKTSELIFLGFQTRYCTEVKVLSNGKQASIIYDVGYVELAGDDILIFQNQEY